MFRNNGNYVLTQALNYFLFTGYCFIKPELIFTLEQGEDPWSSDKEKEFLSRSYPGKLLNTGRFSDSVGGGKELSI
jgi:hypothetical protein